MLKMFSTQLTGLFKRLQEKEEFSIEDSARLLAQAAAGDGKIYIYGTKEMAAIGYEAVQSQEPLRDAAILESDEEVSETDRVIIFSRHSDDEDAVALAKSLSEKGIPFVAVSTIKTECSDNLADLADVHIDLKLAKGLLPDEEGNRFGYPASMAALFVYYGIKFTIEEILAEYE
ncbi:uncharacterized protein DUF2529 [Cytobacillus firmus]|uniref:Uncharacterized protein DUF2529 n=2 Tax=Cytobacillus TaxID=2675230 RepID=A0A366JYT3_CYTFI|nr:MULTISPECIES: DUF2529 domain-containing protein [Cytobacillus]RBP94604.1 uncharacterized protein DUF2529 [Cytobacillus firmus]TDX43350.1 uncharacterized protein DUF2529 [Cytobacillus oceanisediminis]